MGITLDDILLQLSVLEEDIKYLMICRGNSDTESEEFKMWRLRIQVLRGQLLDHFEDQDES